jgi:hypothetical protein
MAEEKGVGIHQRAKLRRIPKGHWDAALYPMRSFRPGQRDHTPIAFCALFEVH